MNKKNLVYTILAIVVLAAIAVCFFTPDALQGRTLQQHDIRQGIANGQEVQLFQQQTGETSRWTNALFSGMPNYQIAPSYTANAMLGWMQTVFGLGLPSPINLLFMFMLGFFCMCLCFKMKWYTSLFAAIAWGFSTYFIIIIGAGHIWKFVTLAYIPPTIGGLALLYRGKYLGGTAMTALFASMQLMSNHPQMTYYFAIVMLALVIAWGIIAYREHKLKMFANATVLAILAGALALAVNSASLYNSYEYSKETVRGKATLLTGADGHQADGMDRDAITAWSYGLDETFTLLIPNVKGGATIKPTGSENRLLSLADTDHAENANLMPQELQFLSQFPQYFGDQPMTNGPVYVGAIVLLLAILALFVVDSPKLVPIKWALFAASFIAVLLAWGHNFSLLTDFCIDNIPGYNKFRAVASILVIPEFCIPLLAAMALYQIATERTEYLKKYRWTLITIFGLGALICFVGWVSPSVFGSPFSISERNQLTQMGILNDPAYASIMQSVRATRLSLVSADSLRSLIYIIVGFGIIILYLKGAFNSRPLFVCALTAVVLIDLFTVNKRYVNSDNFTDAVAQSDSFYPTKADEFILQDNDPNYRVADLGDFNGARSSYFHKTIGGYHAAKLTRYNDLLTSGIMPAVQRLMNDAHANAEAAANDTTAINDTIPVETPRLFTTDVPVLDMLNTKYFMMGDYAEQNPNALGNAWWIDDIRYVNNPDEEMAQTLSIDPARSAVADKAFETTLGQPTSISDGDYIKETSYAPNKLTYSADTRRGGIAVFSEIWFPDGWNVTIDGQPAQLGRVNYVLRALRIPAGKHEIVMTFNPKSLEITNAIGAGGCILIYLLIIAAVAAPMRGLFNRKRQ
ncbi:MAG: YfhO family protein [Muribaculaceae bacterium]|nr:YfhO family protein [Muribaculaceae bacterium]